MIPYTALREYARFLLEHHVDECVHLNLERANEVALPLLSLFRHYTPAELFEFSRKSIITLLTDLSQGTALEANQVNVMRWKANQVPGVPSTGVDARDLAFTPHVRKYAFIKLLSKYTQDLPTYERVMMDIETFYTATLETSLEAYVEIQQGKLQQEKDFLQTIIDNTLEGISAYDTQGRITLWNKALEERTGLPREKVEGSIAYELFPGYIHSREGQAMKRVLAGEKLQLQNMPYQDKEGFYEADLSPLTDAAHTITGVLIVSRDITERKLAEKAVIESKTKFEGIFNQSYQLMALLEENGRILDINHAGLDLIEAEKQTLLGTSMAHSLVFYSQDGKKQMESLIRQAAAGELVRFQTQLKKANGQYIYLDFSIKPIYNEKDETIWLIAEGRDITARVEAEEKLKAQNKIIEGLLTHFPLILSKLNAQGVLLECRGKGLAALGIQDNELVGQNALEIFPQVAQQVRKALGGQTISFEGEIPLRDRVYCYQNFYFYDDLTLGAYGIAVDITAQKELEKKIMLQNQELAQALEELRASEEQLITLNEDLDKRVKQRTEELALAYGEAQRQRNRLNSFFMQAPAAICVLEGPDLVFTLVNPSYQQLFIGRQLLNTPLFEALPEIVGQPIARILMDVYEKGEPFIGNELLFQLVRQEGKPIEDCYFNFIYQPRFNEENKVDGILVFAYEVTQQVLARKTIEESAKRFQLLLESIPSIAWTNGPDGQVTFFNSHWYHFTGLTAEESLAWGWQSVVHPQDLPSVMNQYRDSLASGEIFEVEARFKDAKNDTYRWHLNRAIPLYGEKGEIAQWVGICTDIDDQKLFQQQLQSLTQELETSNEELLSNQEELRQTLDHTVELNNRLQQQEAFLSSIISQSPFSTWISDETGTLIRQNEACLQLFGIEDENQGIGKYNILQDNTLQDKPFYKDIEAVFREGKVARFEIEYDVRQVTHVHIPHGKPITVVTTVFPIKDSKGKVVNAVIQHEDVTQRRQAEAQAAYQNKLVKIITDNASSTLFMMDKQGYCTFMNPAGERMFGYSFDEIREKPLHYLIHHHYPDGQFYPMEDCPLDRALPQNFDIRAHEDLFFRKDGSSLQVSCAASPIFENGMPVSTVIEVRDITREKQAQQLLLQANTELARKNEELQKINTDLDNFVYTASHDLKSPIANLEGFLKMFSRRVHNTIGEQDKAILELMNSSVTKFKETLKSLIEVTKAQKDLHEGKEYVAVSPLLEEVEADIKDMIVISGANISTHFSVEHIFFSKANLRSIIYNLLSNAIKYRSLERTPDIKIHTFQEKDYTVLKVEDNGMGISSSQLPKLFTMFKRFHSHIEGTGIGLYIIKRVVENYGGKIEVESKEGVGTTFKVYFSSTNQN